MGKPRGLPTVGSVLIARIVGIPIRLHPTFVLVPLIAAWSARSRSESVSAALLLVVAVFGCVVLHELGHALVARRLGVRPVDITLYPIGGVARLSSLPSPAVEWRVAVAGPLVNLALAALLSPSLLTPSTEPFRVSLPVTLVWVNLSIFAFNLFPAFPMDGGRMLRAVLALRLRVEPATKIAVGVGQGLALVLVAIGILQRNPWVVLLGAVVFAGAAHQRCAERFSPSFSNRDARSLMVTDFVSLSCDAVVADAARIAVETAQRDFPVIDERGGVRGLLSHAALLEALAESGPESPVDERILCDPVVIGPADNPSRSPRLATETGDRSILVVENGRVVGMIPAELLREEREIGLAQRSHSQM